MVDKSKQKNSPKTVGWQLLNVLLIISIIGFSLCICSFITIIFWHDITGALIENVAHYPNSELIWSGYGVYGSGDYGDKVYYRWTSDDEQRVEAHYNKFPESWRAGVHSVADINTLMSCGYVIG